MRNLSGKCVLITGAGNGLGRDLSLQFSAAGAMVIVTDINETQVVQTVRLVNQARGSDAGLPAIGLPMDVACVADVQRVQRELHRRRQPIDILVNNAGIVFGGPFLHVGLNKHLAVMNVNAAGPLIVTHVFLPDLIARKESHLVMICSASSILPTPLQLSYTASKWAELGFADALRQELRWAGHQHVAVTSVCPSYLDTGMFRGTKMPRLTRKLPSAELATKIVRAVRSKKNYVMAPWIVRLAPLGKELLPLSVGEKLLDWMGITDGMREWVGPGEELASPPDSSSNSRMSRLTREQAPTRRQSLHPRCAQKDEVFGA